MNQSLIKNTEIEGTAPEVWLGIDFSGNVDMWKPGCRRSNVWVAEICKSRLRDNFFRIADLRRAQQLPGAELPFFRLARFLSARKFAAAAIDAPFSIPSAFMPAGGHRSLLAAVSSLECDGKPFARGKTFFNLVSGEHELESKKPLRLTEAEWFERGVNVRSTLWARARGGAPMTAACLTLLQLSSCPIWPWASNEQGLLVEAFPAAQLKHWGLPFQQYSGSQDLHYANRRTILDGLRLRVDLGSWEADLLVCADAIDAVVCALAAASVTLGTLLSTPDPSIAGREGWIAISN